MNDLKSLNQLFKEVYGPIMSQIVMPSASIFTRIYYDKYSCISCQEEYDTSQVCKCHIKQSKLGKVLYSEKA